MLSILKVQHWYCFESYLFNRFKFVYVTGESSSHVRWIIEFTRFCAGTSFYYNADDTQLYSSKIKIN